MEYSISVWRPPGKKVEESSIFPDLAKKGLPEHNCWRDVLLKQQGMAEMPA